jgi:surfeit locus 1 family protein
MTHRSYAFAVRPVWMIGHLIALTAVIGFVLLGMWQLDRHQARQAFDARIADRIDTPAALLDDLLGPAAIADVEYRMAIAEGSYLVDDEVILQARTLGGRSGHEVLTPLLLADGNAVIVDRGWVPIDVEGPPVVGAEPPEGRVTVTGYIRTPQVRSGLGPIDPAEGRLDRISRVDVARLASQVNAPLLPLWIQLASQVPSQASPLPLVTAPPQPGGGPPHLSYAVQWFAFAAVVLIAYPILMVRTARRSAEEDTEPGRVPRPALQERQ